MRSPVPRNANWHGFCYSKIDAKAGWHEICRGARSVPTKWGGGALSVARWHASCFARACGCAFPLERVRAWERVRSGPQDMGVGACVWGPITTKCSVHQKVLDKSRLYEYNVKIQVCPVSIVLGSGPLDVTSRKVRVAA